ncbi:Sigma-24 [uncultured Ruminococcus sp.]|jgi:RNA polymerase sigma factor (sigma-70 family)|uniref:Sigma-70 family RNA polymerase sigma factor n=1 Tax=Hominimerdicola aceti TaxID=2981726 RepID=A0AAE3IH62_9FIRM|nr:sigma-70 family RNA polymerase sigma factor [Hominimerdicola aceti]MCU6706211.1 sigma-70 family RNA polymerase sigma factor [Hominimerdicola aceti]SCI95143.1 Sigma-24 [uncultured Ruminococcus sp.]
MKEDVDYTEAVEKAKQGDQQAKEVLYIETCQHMFFLAKSIVKSDEEAMDIIHDSYICVFQKLDNIKNAAGFKSYLRTTVANRCKNYLRKKKPLYLSDMTEDGTELELEDTDGVIPGELVGNEDVIECVRRVVESLPEEQRMCVILRYYDEMSLQEIADTLEISLGTVKSRLSRANKKMRDEIERLEEEENKKFRCIIPFFWLRAGLEGMENETDVPKALEVKVFGKSIRRGVSKMARNIIVAAAALAIAGGVFLTACGNDEGKKGTTSSLADTSSISSAAEDSSSEAEVKEPKVFECELEAGSEMTAAELAAKLSDDKIDTAAFASGEEKIALDKLGVQSISLNIKLATGEEELWNITVTVVDSEKPKFTGIKEKYEITEGGKLPDFKKGVSVKDNYDESVEFTAELDGKAKKFDYKAGKYTITYKAKDSSGNEVTATSKLIIKEKPEEEKKDDEKSEEPSDNNNNGNSDNNGGGSSNNNGGGNSNNGGNGGGNSNNGGGNGNGGSQNNGGGSSNNNGGGSSNNNDGNSGSGGGGKSWSWDDDEGHHEGTIDDGTTPGGNTQGTGTRQYGDPFGWGYDYWYVVYPNGEITTI